MAVGSVWMINHWLLLSFLSIFFAGIYHFIILAEEKKLQRIFHKAYTQYCQLVPRFFPSLQFLFFPARSQVGTRHSRFVGGESFDFVCRQAYPLASC